MYHPYLHETAKHEVARRHAQADAANLAAEARAGRPGLVSRFRAKLGALLRGRAAQARRQPARGFSLEQGEAAHSRPGTAETL